MGVLQDLENHIVCGFSGPEWGAECTWGWGMDGAVSGLQLFKAWIIRRPLPCTPTALFWGASACCLAPIVETGSKVSGHLLMMPLPSTRSSHLPSVDGPLLPKRSETFCPH